jgi:hypothetical protein
MRPFSNAAWKRGLEANARRRRAEYDARQLRARRGTRVMLRDIGFMALLLAIAGVLMAWLAPWIERMIRAALP